MYFWTKVLQVIIDVKSGGQENNRLGKLGCVIGWGDDGVDEDVGHVAAAGGGGIAEPCDLWYVLEGEALLHVRE